MERKAEEICKDVSFDEDREITGKKDDIVMKCPNMASKLSSSRKIKSETIARNLKRIADAKKAVDKSCQAKGLNELLTQGSKQEKIK